MASASSTLTTTTHTINHKKLILVDNLLSPEECRYLIAYMETRKPKKISQVGKRCRCNYNRVIMISHEWSKRIYDRVYPILSKGYREDVAINTYFRFSKYDPGGYFSIHRDGFNEDKGRRTFMTINIFLNDNDEFEGGSTSFYIDKRKKVMSVTPKVGRGVIFDRAIYHCGDRVVSGNKYLFHTDVMK